MNRFERCGIVGCQLKNSWRTADGYQKDTRPAGPAGKTIANATLELENAGGVKMRVQLRSTAMPDLAAISQTFWNRQP
jgi:hypothetical protein